MARIHQLSAQEAQKIAAGEVVERPANVVKELLENALDAGANTITLYIEEAGKKLIRIVDNGCGMSPEDAHTCFQHHATSKITRVEDLPSLTTFGFRGEALSSISAVSKVILITKEASASHATKLVLEQAVVQSNEQITGNNGTDIAIADLFYNVPARKKFLKTNDTEWRQIVLLFQAFCLAYKDIHFKLYSQGNQLFNCPPVSDLQQRIAQLWDHTVAGHMLPITSQTNELQVEGIISNHMYSRYDRSSMFLFVNKRWIKNHGISKATLKGYLNVLPPDKFPLACIMLTIDPATIDVNIHPRKEEVQFLHPRIIETAIQTLIKTALEKNLSAQLNKPVTIASTPEPRFQGSSLSFTPTSFALPAKDFESSISYAPSVVPAQHNAPLHTFEKQQIISASSHHTELKEYQIIGQFSKTYVLIEQEDGLFLVDQHAAHERILYELFSTNFKQVATIELMFPPIITLSQQEMHILEPHLDIFSHNNITLERMGSNQLVLRAVPVHLKELAFEELVHQVIGWITEHQKLDTQDFYKKVHEKLHAQMACKAAVKAGDILTLSQMHQLLRDLEKIENRFTCPHGRPTGWLLPLYEIEKKFKRKL